MQHLSINPLVADLSNMCDAVQLTQCMLKQTDNYVTVGEVFMMMSDESLAELLSIVDRATSLDDRSSYKQLVILVLLLARGEGIGSIVDHDLPQHIGQLALLATYEAKSRMGIVTINRDHMTIGDPCISLTQ